MLLFETTHGSYLYNLDHADSDFDTWQIYANEIPSPLKYAKQSLSGKQDVVKMNLSTFMLYANRSNHQVLECMFSDKVGTDLIVDLRHNYFININTFVPSYQRNIRALGRRPDLKSKRHAVRMSYNFWEGVQWGRFNPTLKNWQRQLILSASAQELDQQRLKLMHQL